MKGLRHRRSLTPALEDSDPGGHVASSDARHCHGSGTRGGAVEGAAVVRLPGDGPLSQRSQVGHQGLAAVIHRLVMPVFPCSPGTPGQNRLG